MTKLPVNHLVVKPTAAIEALSSTKDLDLELIGIEPLKSISSTLKLSVEAGGITESARFINTFGLDTNFFYIIESIKNDSVIYYERGIASIYQQDDKFFLKRKFIFLSGKNSYECSVSTDNAPRPVFCHHNTLVYSSIPPTYIEAIASENSVLCSSYSCIPHPVALQNNSVLARLDDKIESLSLDDNRLVSKIVNAIVTFGKQLKLKTSKLSLKRVEPEVIDLVPSSNVKAKKGSLYYDESDDTIKVYDGQAWKTLAFLEE